MLCQYKCPLIDFTIMNQTQKIQDRDCVNVCINELKMNGYTKDQYSSEELDQDSLGKQMNEIIENCTNENTDEETNVIASEAATACVIEKLEELRILYFYLQ